MQIKSTEQIIKKKKNKTKNKNKTTIGHIKIINLLS